MNQLWIFLVCDYSGLALGGNTSPTVTGKRKETKVLGSEFAGQRAKFMDFFFGGFDGCNFFLKELSEESERTENGVGVYNVP